MRSIWCDMSRRSSGRNVIASRLFSWPTWDEGVSSSTDSRSLTEDSNLEKRASDCQGLSASRNSWEESPSSLSARGRKNCTEKRGWRIAENTRLLWTSTLRMSNGEGLEGNDKEPEKKLLEYDQTVLDGGSKHRVIRIDSSGTWQNMVVSSLDLGIHPRDVDLLVNNSFIPRRATIAVQSSKVIMRLENVRALIAKDHALVFDTFKSRTTGSSALSSGTDMLAQLRTPAMQQRAREAFAEAIVVQASVIPPPPLEPMPFHLRVVECLLEETNNFFHKKVERLKVVGEKMVEELTIDVNMGGLQTLLPLKRTLTEVEHDLRDIHEAIDQVLGSDDTLEALWLDLDREKAATKSIEEREDYPRKARQAAADMLLTYQREIDDAGGVLEELKKDMDAAVEVWELGLDTTRNRIIRMNLFISIATLSLTVAAIPANFFGMNLVSGLENHPNFFYMVLGTAATASVTVFLGMVFVYRIWPKFADIKRQQDLGALRDLLKNLDDIDEIFHSVVREVAKRPVTAQEFRRILRAHPASRFMRQRELDMMFRMFDTNKNGMAEAGDLEELLHHRRNHNDT